MEDQALRNEEKIGKLWTALEKLRGVVLGNGTEGHEQRIGQLEDRVKPENCIGIQALNKHLQEIKEMQEKRRTFRIGDLANVIQIAILLLMAYQLFK